MTVRIVGGGLAGCEAAWQLARRGVPVVLYEMRPVRTTPAHRTARLAEIVCSNSFRSEDPASAAGVLKEELAALDSLVLRAARAARVPGGKALCFDRDAFAAHVEEAIASLPGVTVVREEVTEVPEAAPDRPVVVATGPLTSDPLAASLAERLGAKRLHFYDAIAPIVAGETIDKTLAFFASRGGADDDYLNLPLSEEEYRAFVAALREAVEKGEVHQGFDTARFFEGCLPIEAMAVRGEETLRHGPMKPWGLRDPRTGREPYAVVQCRREDLHGEYWNLVGFQTQLLHAAQDRIFRMVPALRNARFLRHGSAHRNTYFDSPEVLTDSLEAKAVPGLFLAGQITGVEGYIESAGTGLLAGLFVAARCAGRDLPPPPETTILGGLLRYITTPKRDFQPMKANWALVPEPEARGKRNRAAARAARARRDLADWIARYALDPAGAAAVS